MDGLCFSKGYRLKEVSKAVGAEVKRKMKTENLSTQQQQLCSSHGLITVNTVHFQDGI